MIKGIVNLCKGFGRFWLTVIIVSGILSCSENNTPIPGETEEPDTEDNWYLKENAFSYRLTNYLGAQIWDAITDNDCNENQNFIFSPVGINMLLSMLANGADGTTRNSLETLLLPQESDLDVNTSLEDLNRFNRDFASELESADFTSKIKVANGLWYDEAVVLKPDFETAMKSYYGRVFRSNDVSTDFDEWSSSETSEMISGIMSDDSSANIIAGNVFCFSSTSSRQFYGIENGLFVNSEGEETEVEMMLGVLNDVPWTKTTTAEYVWIPLGEAGYKEGLQLVLVLPNEGADTSFSNIFNGEYVEGDNQYSSASYDITLRMPLLSVESLLNIREYSAGLGIEKVFDSSANFSNMTTSKNLCIDQLIQACRIEFNDKSFNASHVSAGISGSRARDIVIGKKEITVSGPFAFMVLNNNMTLIMGKICNL